MSVTDLLNQRTPDAFKRWGQQLTQQSLAQALSEVRLLVDTLVHSPDKLEVFNVMEAARPFIHALNPLIKDEPDEVDAHFYIELLALETSVYEHILEKPSELSEHVLVATIHRSLTNKIQEQVVHYRYYFLIPERKWLRIHRLFYVAMKNKIATFGISDHIYFPDQETSITNLYCYLLLLSCARLAHFKSNDIVKVSHLLTQWCHLVKLSKTPSTTAKNQIVVDIATGSAPHFTKLFSPNESTIPCYLQVDELMQMLVGLWMEQSDEEEKLQKERQLKQREPEPEVIPESSDVLAARSPQSVDNPYEAKTEEDHLSADVLEYLKAAWSGYLYQEQLSRTHQTVEVCIGFKDVHFYLSGAKTLREFLGAKAFFAVLYDEVEDKELIERYRMTDLWSTFLAEPKGEPDFKKTPSEFNFQHHFKGVNEEACKNEHPRYSAMMTEIGVRECDVVWNLVEAPPLELGQLVALRRQPNDHWQLGEIDWKIQLNNSKIKTGIKIISTHAIPVGLDLPFGLTENYCEAILTPPEKMLDSVTSFIAEPRDYRIDSYVGLAQKNIEEKLKIVKLIHKNDYFERCQCVFLIRKRVNSTYKKNEANEVDEPQKPMHR